MKLRVATYNIHKGVSSIRSTPRVLALKKAIALFDADVVFLQEVQGRCDRKSAKYGEPARGQHHWPEMAQHEFFADDGHHTAYGMNAVYDHGHHGNALLSRYPIANQKNHDVSDHRYESRGILHCEVQTVIGTVHCYVVHLGLFENGRKRQGQALIECVRASAPKDEPIVIAGDFNDWRNTLSDQLREELHVREVFDDIRTKPARTFPAMMPWFRLDRIYVRGFKVEHAEVLHGTVWGKLSDHAPIVANLELSL